MGVEKRIIGLLFFVLVSSGIQAQFFTNMNFELPNTGKVTNNWAAIPGWTSNGATTDSGVEEYRPTASAPYGTNGDYTLFIRSSDPEIYQTSSYTLQEGDSISVTFDTRASYLSCSLIARIYYQSGGSRITLTTSTTALTYASPYAFQSLTLSFVVPTGHACIGNNLGVGFDNTAGIGYAYLQIDDVQVFDDEFLLPIELASFKIEKQGNGVKINWITNLEINNDYFEIQRSSNGTDFETIDRIPGAGTSNSVSNYEYLDTPQNGQIYYRLNQVDFDGKSTLSSVKQIEIGNSSDETQSVSLFPNPNSGQFSFLGGVSFNRGDLITILNPVGEVVFEQSITEEFSKNQSLDLNTSLPNGIYFLRYNNQSHMFIVEGE
jgi:hypothetical protein